MKKLLSLALSFTVSSLGLVALAAKSARAQQVASAGASISKIKEEYERLLAVDRDPSTEPDVREMNRKFLEERRAQLRAAIETRLGALRKYQTSMSGTLSPAEGLVVNNSIQALERDLSAIEGDVKPSPAAQWSAKPTPVTRSRTATATPPADADAASKASEPARPAAPAAAPAPFAGDITLDGAHKDLEGILKITVTDKVKKAVKLVVTGPDPTDKTKTKELSSKTIKLERGVNEYLEKVTLAEGDNTITVSDVDDANVKDSVTWKGAKPADADAAAPTPKPTPATPRFDFIEAGQTNITVLDTVPGATVKLYRNGEDLATGTAHGGSVLIKSPKAADIGDHFEADQTDGDKTSLRGRFTVSEGPFDSTAGTPFGVLVGGAVISQQADAFQQADPFFGFLAGYNSQVKNRYKGDLYCHDKPYSEMDDHTFADGDGFVVRCDKSASPYVLKYRMTDNSWVADPPRLDTEDKYVRNHAKRALNAGFGANRWNVRFQGIFQSDPRKAVATATPAAGATPTPTPTATPTPGGICGPSNEPCFIASRKTFDIEMHAWWDFWANNSFTIGPYVAVGASSVTDKNELDGETVNTSNQSGNNTAAPITANATSSNDLKKFYEVGMLSNTLLFNKSLFVQSILAYGNYEALDGLYAGYNTKKRFVGKLRVFPSGLSRGFGRQIQAAPMFGVDLNAGRGPDHLKFFTGFAVAIKGFSFNPAAK